MCRGLGKTEGTLLVVISRSPKQLTFAGIVELLLTEIGCNTPFTVWREGRASHVRSMRRALRSLVDKGFVFEFGCGGRRQPHSYWLNPQFAEEAGIEISNKMETIFAIHTNAVLTRAAHTLGTDVKQ